MASTKGISITQDATSLRQTQDTLQVLADNTDGRAIVNRNDLADWDEADHPRLERLLSARL